MKKLSRNEMKKVMGGNQIKTLWRCQVDDYMTEGGITWELCNTNNPNTSCVDTWGCSSISTCDTGPECINY